MRARLITMPPSTGSAPPLSPVPDPRATKGISSRWQTRTTACTCSRRGAERPRAGISAEVGQAVALVGAELVGLNDEAGGTDDALQFLEERVHRVKGYYEMYLGARGVRMPSAEADSSPLDPLSQHSRAGLCAWRAFRHSWDGLAPRTSDV